MVENEFGKLLEKLINLSSQKNYALAMTLGYDVSYISKWINLSSLPTSKNIKVINKKIATFIVSSSNKLELDNIANYFDIKILKDMDINLVLENRIEEELNKSYLYSYNKSRNKDLNKSDNYNNSMQTTDSSQMYKYINYEISTFMNETSQLDIILLCNLSKLNNEDKVKIAGIDISNGKQKKIKKNNTMITYLLRFEEKSNDLLFDMSLLIYMATSKKRLNTRFYSGDFPQNIFISLVRGKCSHTVLYDNNNKRLMSVTSTDSKAVDEVYEILKNMIYTQSRQIFLKIMPEEFILSYDKINYINGESKILAGEMTELFMPSDLFLEVGKKVFGLNEEVLSKLNKIDKVLQEFIYNCKIDMVIYEDILKNYIYNGDITFFNNQITLTVEQRKRHIEYMKTILEKNNNINVNLADDSLLDNYKEDEKIFLSISNENTFLREKDNGKSKDYLIVKDIKLEKLLRLFFSEIWNENHKESDKNKIINLIKYFGEYIDIISKN